MKRSYPEFSGAVSLYAVNIDSFETLADLELFSEEFELPFPVVVPLDRMLADLRILSQSTKIGIDATGRIIYRGSYGKGGENDWRDVFSALARETYP